MAKLSLIAALLLAIPASLQASVYDLLPRPKSVSTPTQDIRFNALTLPGGDLWQAEWKSWAHDAGISTGKESNAAISVAMVDSIPGAHIQDEAYTLEVKPDGIDIQATSPKGVYWAIQTLRQLQNADGTFPVTRIADWPAYPWRGFMMDVGRTYISVPEILTEIELLSRFKINVYHWHLTENQAWRLESKVYPHLTSDTVITRQPGKFYTHEDARRIMDFARAHNVTLVPELDMPGHSAAFERAFGHSMQTPQGKEEIRNLITEACLLFDSVPYLHVGTDEVRFTDSTFVPEMVALVRSLGKKAISWNPGWNYQPGEIDMIHMWSYRGHPIANAPSIDSKLHYINHFDTFADIVALYRSTVYDRQQSDSLIVGSALAIWNDRYLDSDSAIVGQNGLYPHVLALAERTWMGGGTEYFGHYGSRLVPEDTADFNQFVDFERRLLHHKDGILRNQPIPYVRQTDARWLLTDPFPNGGDLTASFPPETEGMKDSYTFDGNTYGTREVAGSGAYLRHYWGEKTVAGVYEKPEPNSTAYAFTRIWSEEPQTVGLYADFQNYSRSESDIQPPQGMWDIKGSRIFINGQEIMPPVWTSTLTERSNEVPLGNENAASRPPLPVHLNAGWNDVMLKLPIGQFSTKEARLVKWMFNVAFVTPDGRHTVPLTYNISAK